MEDIDFSDLAPREVKVRVGPQHFVLREASGDAAIKYRNAQMRANKTRWDETKNRIVFVGMDGLADVEPVLVAACLYAAHDGKLPTVADGSADPSKLVTEAVIRGWPVRVQTALFSWIMDNSEGLRDEEDSPKNGQASPTTTAGSGLPKS